MGTMHQSLAKAPHTQAMCGGELWPAGAGTCQQGAGSAALEEPSGPLTLAQT